jgi:hypothetical protein
MSAVSIGPEAHEEAPPLFARLRSLAPYRLFVSPTRRARSRHGWSKWIELRLRPRPPSVRQLAVGEAVAVGESEGGVPGGVVAVDVGAADGGRLAGHVVPVDGSGRGVVRWRCGELVAVPGRGTARQRGYGSRRCGPQGGGCGRGDARLRLVSSIRRHRWLLRAAARVNASVQDRRKYSGTAPRRRGSRAGAAARVQSNFAHVTRPLAPAHDRYQDIGAAESDQQAAEVPDPVRGHQPGSEGPP